LNGKREARGYYAHSQDVDVFEKVYQQSMVPLAVAN